MLTLREIYLREEEIVAKLQNVQGYWELGIDGKEVLESYLKKSNDKFFKFEPGKNATAGGFYNFSRKAGSGYDISTGKTLPIAAKHLALNVEDKEFQISSNLQDPKMFSIISSTIKYFPEFKNFSVVKFTYSEEDDEWEKINFGTVNNLLSKSKNISGKSPAYGEDRYEEFELQVFKELSEDNWYHATTKTNFDSIKKDGFLKPSGNNRGEGWTEFNLALQRAVYLTKNKQYAYRIANTIASRFEQDAYVVEINGQVLKTNGYKNVVVDEDSLRNDYDGSIASIGRDEDFISFNSRLPEFLTSVTDKIESVGYKGNISTSNIIDVDIVSYEKDSEDDF